MNPNGEQLPATQLERIHSTNLTLTQARATKNSPFNSHFPWSTNPSPITVVQTISNCFIRIHGHSGTLSRRTLELLDHRVGWIGRNECREWYPIKRDGYSNAPFKRSEKVRN